LPYLSATEGLRVLAALDGAACLDAKAGSWPRLLRLVATRDAAAFGALAETMLADGSAGTEVRGRYLLGMAMLGHLGGGAVVRARAVWERFGVATLRGKPAGLALDILSRQALREPAAR
jgi:hypothetical protein